MIYKNKKISINKKLITYFTLVMLVGITTIGILVNLIVEREFSNYISKQHTEDINKLIKNINSSYQYEGWNKDYIESLGIKYLDKGMIIEVYDRNKNLIWSANEYDRNMCHSKLKNIKDDMIKRYSKWDGDYKEELFNIENEDNKIIGFLKVGHYGPYYYMDNELDFLKEINRVIIIVGTIVMIIVILISLVLAKGISKPIKKVSDVTKIIEAGNYNKKIDYESNIVEVNDLINSINNLASSLNNQEELRKRLTIDIAHELRTPLTSVKAHLEAIIDGIWEPSPERLNSINEEVSRLVGLVNQLRKLSKFDMEIDKLQVDKTDTKELIKNIIFNLQGSALDKNINIEYNLENISTNLDKDKISQVIFNILSNSIRYTNENGSINITSFEVENRLIISIKDNGIGIPKDDLENIFERFYRVDKSRSKLTGGIGVGLTISKAIVNAHGGNIFVESELGEGSEFKVEIPIKD
ncbi:sensor histidine kinase [Paraclostridium bifermentans]|uniref:sensor histidine kinase n=1 Tax=Paraclostridium bifermentans TaxID=1490 RepID=UPI00359CB9DE